MNRLITVLNHVSGGLYHDDGFVKHGLPTASAVTVMLWGLVDYKKAYESTGEFTFGKRQLRWILDYYQKAHVSKYELYVQVCSRLYIDVILCFLTILRINEPDSCG